MRKAALILAAALAAASCSEQTAQGVLGILQALTGAQEEQGTTQNSIMEAPAGMEIPASVKGSTTVTYSAYTSSYNQTTLIPDWVAYELTADETDGDELRGDRMFSMDKRVKGPQAMREDYYDSGWTKGHMAPASDFRWSADAMDDTFHFTNVCPQNEYLNGKDWEYLENRVRDWAEKFGKAWVVTGPIIGTGKYGKIGEHGVTVPDAFYKAVMVNSKGKYRAIAFVMFNDDNRYWLKDCAVSINDVEKMTGLDLYPALDDKIEESVEDEVSLSFWGL